MCSYCSMTSVNKEHACKEYFIHKAFAFADEHTHELIKSDVEHPVMYLREYRNEGGHVWSLIIELADDAGTVLETPAMYCPRCGDKLTGKNNG